AHYRNLSGTPRARYRSTLKGACECCPSDVAGPVHKREISTDPLRMHDIQGRPTVAEVSLGALRTNLRAARELVGPAVKVLAVVKADGYGHGAVAAARAFVEAGAAALGVSTVEEGAE